MGETSGPISSILEAVDGRLSDWLRPGRRLADGHPIPAAAAVREVVDQHGNECWVYGARKLTNTANQLARVLRVRGEAV